MTYALDHTKKKTCKGVIEARDSTSSMPFVEGSMEPHHGMLHSPTFPPEAALFRRDGTNIFVR